MQFISHRRIIVAFCFATWIGAAGLICRARLQRPLEGEETQFKAINPSDVVHAETTITPTRVTLAQR
jgi:hypothetical protein